MLLLRLAVGYSALLAAAFGCGLFSILVLPGQVISWTIENQLDASSFSVY